MFTGIIETLGKVVDLKKDKGNLHLTVESSLSHELKIDQSISHNGVCLTVVEQTGNTHVVTAIDETLQKSNLGDLEIGQVVNLERCTQVGGRLDGHIVQGHVDQVGTCIAVNESNGSWIYTFEYDPDFKGNVTVEKGSITINGISLTVFNTTPSRFSVAIIPYTYENTNMHTLQVGSKVNLEFDIVGKYVAKLFENYKK